MFEADFLRRADLANQVAPDPWLILLGLLSPPSPTFDCAILVSSFSLLVSFRLDGALKGRGSSQCSAVSGSQLSEHHDFQYLTPGVSVPWESYVLDLRGTLIPTLSFCGSSCCSAAVLRAAAHRLHVHGAAERHAPSAGVATPVRVADVDAAQRLLRQLPQGPPHADLPHTPVDVGRPAC